MVVDTPFVYAETAGADEPRPGLSTVKLYIADYVARHGKGSAEELRLAKRAVTVSDDGAAEVLFRSYPQSIDRTADIYGLSHTAGNGYWGIAQTSPRDAARFLRILQYDDPDAKVLEWMAASEERAADGTPQNWGSALLPGVEGTKWGWADQGVANVASASYGEGFAVATHTYGRAAQQTADVREADLRSMLVDSRSTDGVERLLHPADPDIVGWGERPFAVSSVTVTDTDLTEAAARAAQGSGSSAGGGGGSGGAGSDGTGGAGSGGTGAGGERRSSSVGDLLLTMLGEGSKLR